MPEVAEEAGIKPPAILVVGEVVTLRDSLNWFETRPLFGRRIVVTRARAQASDMPERKR
jgi:uroporphyrinogen III methyltransferase/synthase